MDSIVYFFAGRFLSRLKRLFLHILGINPARESLTNWVSTSFNSFKEMFHQVTYYLQNLCLCLNRELPFNKINDLGALFFILNPISKLYTYYRFFFHEISHTKTNDVSHDCIVIHTFHRSIQKESDHHFRISKMLTFGWFLRTSIL